MPNWTRPVTLRPQLCACELVYILDDDLTDFDAREASVTPVEIEIAHDRRKEEESAYLASRRLRLVRHAETREIINHKHARPTAHSGHGDFETIAPRHCEHHAHLGPVEAHRAVAREGNLLNDALVVIASSLPIEAAALSASATMDAERVLSFDLGDMSPFQKRHLEGKLAAAGLGHVRVR